MFARGTRCRALISVGIRAWMPQRVLGIVELILRKLMGASLKAASLRTDSSTRLRAPPDGTPCALVHAVI